MIYCDKDFIGKKLKEYRKKTNFTQEEISSKAGIDEKHYGKLERGVFLPSLETFFKLVEILNIPLEDFGIKPIEIKNEKRENLIREIYLSDEKEIEAFFEIIQAIKKLK